MALALFVGGMPAAQAEEIQFNTDVLDVNDRKNIDLSQFARGGFIGARQLQHGGTPKQERSAGAAGAVFTRRMTIRTAAAPAGHRCWWSSSALGMSATNCAGGIRRVSRRSQPARYGRRGDLATSALKFSASCRPISTCVGGLGSAGRWGRGEYRACIADYNLNAQTQRQLQYGGQSYGLSGNEPQVPTSVPGGCAPTGQANVHHQIGSGQPTEKRLDGSRYYAYRRCRRCARSLPSARIISIPACSTASAWRDEPAARRHHAAAHLRGYAPEVVGVAKSNAKVAHQPAGKRVL
ncbi:hypothetical protein M8494_36050 [Serratia ureilytica]